MSAKCAQSGPVFSNEEMADALFDTTVFIDAYNGHQGAEHLVQQVITGARTASVSPISVFELWLRSMTRREEMRHRALLALLEEAYWMHLPLVRWRDGSRALPGRCDCDWRGMP